MKDFSMELLADGLLIATALTAGLYCLVLGRRLRALRDSAGEIGPRLEALDRTLAETRSRLAETREAIPSLARQNERAIQCREALEAAVAKAETILDDLYRAERRITAHEAARKTPSGDGDDPPGHMEGDGAAEADPAGAGAVEIPGRRVVLPEGRVIEAPTGPEAGAADEAGNGTAAATMPGGRAGEGARRPGGVLRAARVIL